MAQTGQPPEYIQLTYRYYSINKQEIPSTWGHLRRRNCEGLHGTVNVVAADDQILSLYRTMTITIYHQHSARKWLTDWHFPHSSRGKRNTKQGTRVTRQHTGANGDGAHYTDRMQFNVLLLVPSRNDEWAQDGFRQMITVVSDSWRAAQTRSQHAVN